nr:MAG TPA: Exonuclease [Caudoviricetes sp.]DAS16943.1 MAG TPA: Exonuclease [Caudoviricetes sp.]
MKEDSVIKDRGKYIGGSDISIIMGISPFKTRFDLLLEKAGLKENTFVGNEYTEYGDKLEPKIRDFINETLYQKNKFRPNCKIVGKFRGNCDGENHTSILEIKTTSQIHQDVNEYKLYLVQLLKYMEIYEKEKGVLAVYSRPNDFNEEFDNKRLQIFMIDIDNYKDLLKEINEEIDKFLIDLAKLKQNSFLTEEDLLPKDITAQANLVLELERDVIVAKMVLEKYEEEKEKLRLAMVNANVKKWETPNGIKITKIDESKDYEVDVFDEETFKKENEELYKKYQIKKTKKGRKGSLKITIPNFQK